MIILRFGSIRSVKYVFRISARNGWEELMFDICCKGIEHGISIG
jgi:hypothetical protein